MRGKTFKVEPEFHQESIQIPRRPQWDPKWKKDKIKANEEAYFEDYLDKIYAKYKPDEINQFEHNLGVWRELWRCCEISDILLLMTDARHPLFHFSPSLYRYVVVEKKKPLVLLMNKIDLVPKATLEGWKRYFASQYPGLHILPFTSFPQPSDQGKLEKQTGKRVVGSKVYTQGALYKAENSKKHLLREKVDVSPVVARVKDILTGHGYHVWGESSANSASSSAATDSAAGSAEGSAGAPPANHSSQPSVSSLVIDLNTAKGGRSGPPQAEREEEKETKEEGAGGDILSPHASSSSTTTTASSSSSSSSTTSEQQQQEQKEEQQQEQLLWWKPVKEKKSQWVPKAVVGLVGQPNTGKSSILNALLGRAAVSVSQTPGKTKHLQTMRLDNELMLCDCPGLVFPSVKVDRALQVLLGVFPLSQLREPYTCIRFLAERLPLEQIYNLKPPRGSEAQVAQEEFEGDMFAGLSIADESSTYKWSAWGLCEAFAQSRSYTLKGGKGRWDTHHAASDILADALCGALVFAFEPPDVTVTNSSPATPR